MVRTRQLTRLKGGEYFISGISPDGRQLLVSGPNYRGLYLFNMKRGKVEKINEDPGAGYEPCFSGDGRYVFFRADEYIGQKKFSTMSQYEIATGTTRTLQTNSRNVTPPVFSGSNLFYSADGRYYSERIEGERLKSTTPDIYVLPEDLTPVLYINGVRKPLEPNGGGSYIWISLSPDRTKLLYYFIGKGAFVSDLEGKILCSPGRTNAPKWLNNQIIVGMDDKDDGYRVISSEIVCYSVITKEKINLTSTSSRVEMYPMPFPDGRRIAFQTLEGDIFIMHLKTN